MREIITRLALKMVGCPYIWGGSAPWVGFDCSGFIVWLYQVAGVLPSGDWTAQGLHNHFFSATRNDDLFGMPGNLVFYGAAQDKISHVMMVVGSGLVVGASGGDHTTTTVEEARRRGAMVKVKPARYRKDLITELVVRLPRD